MFKNLKKTDEKGFTLIEILVVIGIIAILAAVVLIAINPARQFAQANDSQRTSNINAILNAVGQYMSDHQGQVPDGVPAVPTTATEATAAITNTLGSAAGAFCDALVPDYLPALPVDPSAGDPIDEADCAGGSSAWDSKYTIVRHDNGRISVRATSELDDTVILEVTR